MDKFREKFAWSYSSLSLFQQCPKKYYNLRVIKSVKAPPSRQMLYGLEVHRAAEHYVRDGAALPSYLEYIKPVLDSLKRKEGEKLCEYRLGLTEQLEPCGFSAKEVWWRGIADLVIINGEEAKILDYKTGKDTYADTKQLELLSLAIFKHFPAILIVKSGLLFLTNSNFITADFSREQEDELWEYWKYETDRLKEAYATDVWNPQINFTCKGWCPVFNCVHNGKGR